MILEACVETLQEARIAEERGATRIELCAELSVGGTTPSYALIESTFKVLQIPVMVMVRPRGGNFVYNEMELKIMEQTIDVCKSIGVNGVVFGLLTADHHVNIKHTTRLVKRANGLNITFHKAIDDVAEILDGVNSIKEIEGITAILTSGGKDTAMEGAETINKMADTAEGKIKIIAAGRITSENIEKISALINTNEFHGRKIVGLLH